MSKATSLTFNGIIPLIPDVLIDNFETIHANSTSRNNIAKYCIISHAHCDHYKGLSGKFLKSKAPKFILTKTTKHLILCHTNTPTNIEKNLTNAEFAEMNVTKELEPGLKYTFIPNYHCLGSAMVLIKDLRGGKALSVLYTGDARFEYGVIYSIRTSTILSPYIFGSEPLNMLYLDTTFSYRNRNIEILDNLEGIYRLASLIRQYPIGTKFRFLDTIYGFEEVWVKIHDIFASKCNFYFSKNVSRWIEKVKLSNNWLYDDLEKNVNMVDKIYNLVPVKRDKFDYAFYIGEIEECGISDASSIITIKHAIDMTKTEYMEVYLPREINQFEELNCQNQEKEIWNGKFWFNNGGKKQLLNFNYIRCKQSFMFLPLHIKFIYSRHSSYSESKNFVKLFKNVQDIYPMTESFDTWQKGFNMKNFYGINNSSYDLASNDKYGSCNLELRSDDNNLRIIDYWGSSSDRCSDVLNSFNSVSTEVDFDFDPIGQVIRGKETQLSRKRKEGVALKGRVLKTQRREKRRRIERFLNNVDTVGPATFNPQKYVRCLRLDHGIDRELIRSYSLEEEEIFDNKNVMKLKSNLEDILIDINFM